MGLRLAHVGGVKFSVIPWAVASKSPPSAGHEMLQLAYPAAPVTVPSEPTLVPAGSATSQPRAAHALASFAVHELAGRGWSGRGQGS